MNPKPNRAVLQALLNLTANVGITELPQTWDELRLVAKKLTDDTNGDTWVDRYGLLLPLGKGEAFGLDFSHN